MRVRLSSGNYSVIDSGQVFLFREEDELKIDIAAENGFAFSLILLFTKDASNQLKIDKTVEENRITVLCHNFLDQGTGLMAPVSLARIDGKELLLMFWSYLEGGDQKVRSVKYTIFYEK